MAKCHSNFGIGKINCRGEILLELLEKHKLVIANTIYNHRHSIITTWHSPDGMSHNQIDYI